MTDRTQYIAGLRELADLLERHDDLPLPYEGSSSSITVHYLFHGDPKTMLAHFARIVPGPHDKHIWEGYFDLATRLGGPDGLSLKATAFRDQVCERVVTGTRQVTKTVPDPKVEVPTVEVTETVEDVEWVCQPLLAEAEAVPA